MPSPVLLTSRIVIRISGGDARKWLHNLVTSDVENLQAQEARFAALLTPQGKIIADFFVVPDADGLLIDCASAIAASLIKRLSIYKLRADVQISDVSAQLCVSAFWDSAPPPASQGIVFADPRTARMGWRMIAPPGETDSLGALPEEHAAYDAHRIALGVPEGGRDFAYDETFPYEANMDRLHGVDFRKGCYVGQEVVSRVEHRASARKRIVRVEYDSEAPAPFTPIMANEIIIGQTGSSSGRNALALLRLDKADDAKAAGHDLTADGVTLRPL
ncbi:MAG: folate-binding protein YgfZ [Alphaproteobacteria bacterium]|nr:folate-binding protein YgfZ [Alphaproteobacteria bacterium]